MWIWRLDERVWLIVQIFLFFFWFWPVYNKCSKKWICEGWTAACFNWVTGFWRTHTLTLSDQHCSIVINYDIIFNNVAIYSYVKCVPWTFIVCCTWKLPSEGTVRRPYLNHKHLLTFWEAEKGKVEFRSKFQVNHFGTTIEPGRSGGESGIVDYETIDTEEEDNWDEKVETKIFL